jgi:hypothetical protein
MRLPAFVFTTALAAGGIAWAQLPPRVVPPRTTIVTPWVTTSCWIEHRWFDTLRNGPMDYCKRSLSYQPGRIDCVIFTEETCWALNQQTGEWQLLRTPGLSTLIVCPEGPEPPTCPRMH